MAEAQIKSGRRTLPPHQELRRYIDDPDSQNVVLRAIQTPKVKDVLVNVSNPRNRDLLDLDQDASRDAALKNNAGSKTQKGVLLK